MTPEERFDELVHGFLAVPGIVPPGVGRGFGSSAIRHNGTIFAMLVRHHLVVKLPAKRVDELVGQGEGVPFDANKGIPMKQWFVLDNSSTQPWSVLAVEALEFVRNS